MLLLCLITGFPGVIALPGELAPCVFLLREFVQCVAGLLLLFGQPVRRVRGGAGLQFRRQRLCIPVGLIALHLRIQ